VNYHVDYVSYTPANRPIFHYIEVTGPRRRAIRPPPEAEPTGDNLYSLPTREAPVPNQDDCAARVLRLGLKRISMSYRFNSDALWRYPVRVMLGGAHRPA
jgi:hypothetical protein